MRNRKRTKWKVIAGTICGLSLLGFGLHRVLFPVGPTPEQKTALRLLTKRSIALQLSPKEESPKFQGFPASMEMTLPFGEKIGQKQKVRLAYTFDEKLQADMVELFSQYRPDHGALVAVDASTGRVLSMVGYSDRPDPKLGHMALRATFPSASVFKVVTAAAAIAVNKYSSDTVISFTGQDHTLYRRNILESPHGRWARTMSLKQAFARSVNTVFGRIGAFTVGAGALRSYADRFGFNRTMPVDLPVEESRAVIPEDPFGVAESASGYTLNNTMSPLQGAMIAAVMANDGWMMEPYAVDRVYSEDGKILYEAKPTVSSQVIPPETAAEVRELMRETVTSGTSRRSFRSFFRTPMASALDIGGKTGSLTGTDPKGKVDWFVGYARDAQDHRIAFAAVTIHDRFWKVKSAYLVRKAIESYFEKLAPRGDQSRHDLARTDSVRDSR